VDCVERNGSERTQVASVCYEESPASLRSIPRTPPRRGKKLKLLLSVSVKNSVMWEEERRI
jgi:hypothetical protein